MMTQDKSGRSLKVGRYRHFKGGEYDVIGLAKHTETGEAMVVYRYLYDDFGLSVRPLVMFDESVELGGELIPRFTYIGNESISNT